MSKGFAENKKRKDMLTSFAKDLVRRSKSSCELCDAREVRLEVYEVPPLLDEAMIERCLLVCDICLQSLLKPRLMDANHFQTLNKTVWSDIPAVQVTAVRILRKFADKHSWAQDLLEQIYLDPEVESWVEQIEE